MKKESFVYSKEYKWPHLFLEDLEKIEKVILNEAKANSYSLNLHNCKYDSANEIKDDFRESSELYIYSYSPYIRVSFSGVSASLNVSDDNISALAVGKRISDIIKKRERKLFKYVIYLFNLLAIALYTGILIIPSRLIPDYNKYIKLSVLLACLLFPLAIVLAAVFIRINHFSKIEFVYNKDKQTFWRTNRDKIIVSVVTGLFGTVIGTMIGVWATKFFFK